MIRIQFGLIICVFMTACGSQPPSQEQIQTAIAQTQTAQPPPTNTPLPTSTPTPSFTPTPDPCSKQGALEYREQVMETIDRYNNAMKLLAITVKSSQAIAIANMIEIQEEFRQASPPDCGSGIHAATLDYMDAALKWGDVIYKDLGDAEYNNKLGNIQVTLLNFVDAMDKYNNEMGLKEGEGTP